MVELWFVEMINLASRLKINNQFPFELNLRACRTPDQFSKYSACANTLEDVD